MNTRELRLIVVLLSAFLPVTAGAQCKDQLCRNLQNILGSAEIDFRGYLARNTPMPDVSTDGTKVSCQMSTWANNVPMYICYAQVPYANAADWYTKTLDGLRGLSPDWHFQIKSPGQDHYVDAGPPDCEVSPTEGPYIGQCPLHLQIAKQSDGTAKVYLWVNSLTSPYLLHRVVAPAAAKVPAQPTAAGTSAGGCDGLCQGLKRAFEGRFNSFQDLRGGPPASGDDPPAAKVKLDGARDCVVSPTRSATSAATGTQYVCYWQESSATAAEARFHDLAGRFQVLIPSNWSTRQGIEVEDSTGVSVTTWQAVEPGGKRDVRIYLSGEALGLHITAWE